MSMPASDDVFRTLFGFRICETAFIEEETGRVGVIIKGQPMTTPVEHIDELERRGWITMSNPDEIGITKDGIYWLNRWGKKVAKQNVMNPKVKS